MNSPEYLNVPYKGISASRIFKNTSIFEIESFLYKISWALLNSTNYRLTILYTLRMGSSINAGGSDTTIIVKGMVYERLAVWP